MDNRKPIRIYWHIFWITVVPLGFAAIVFASDAFDWPEKLIGFLGKDTQQRLLPQWQKLRSQVFDYEIKVFPVLTFVVVFWLLMCRELRRVYAAYEALTVEIISVDPFPAYDPKNMCWRIRVVSLCQKTVSLAVEIVSTAPSWELLALPVRLRPTHHKESNEISLSPGGEQQFDVCRIGTDELIDIYATRPNLQVQKRNYVIRIKAFTATGATDEKPFLIELDQDGISGKLAAYQPTSS